MIVWALRDPEERKEDFEETWTIPYEAKFVSRDEAGVVAAGVEEAFASGYTIVDKAYNGTDPMGGIAYFKKEYEICE